MSATAGVPSYARPGAGQSLLLTFADVSWAIPQLTLEAGCGHFQGEVKACRS